MFEKGDCTAKSKGLLHFIDFNFVFNLTVFCDTLQILKKHVIFPTVYY